MPAAAQKDTLRAGILKNILVEALKCGCDGKAEDNAAGKENAGVKADKDKKEE